MRWFSKHLLRAAEWVFLRANGWRPAHKVFPKTFTKEGDFWVPPEGYNTKKGKEPHRRGHAINSQKWMNSLTKKHGVIFSDGDSR